MAIAPDKVLDVRINQLARQLEAAIDEKLDANPTIVDCVNGHKVSVIIQGEYADPTVRKRVRDKFLSVNWDSVEFITSGENNERPGLTRVELFRFKKD